MKPRFPPSCDRSCVKKLMADCFASRRYSLKKTWWSNDKTIIELGYRNIGFTQDIRIVTYNKDIRVVVISLQGTEICEQDDRMNQVGTVSQSA